MAKRILIDNYNQNSCYNLFRYFYKKALFVSVLTIFFKFFINSDSINLFKNNYKSILTLITNTVYLFTFLLTFCIIISIINLAKKNN